MQVAWNAPKVLRRGGEQWGCGGRLLRLGHLEESCDSLFQDSRLSPHPVSVSKCDGHRSQTGRERQKIYWPTKLCQLDRVHDGEGE